ncbi:hypothetical protein [Acetobacter syzygii]|uniref:hypothetical protein n=2 Tax=Acetobacter syzygii TaxID=146476 RepID=UPI0015714FB7|nr:hypothetical protein [Acetobacter syzygii]NSL93534.1 hypothetical protein [Acetobacter syzygii]
MVSYPVPRAPDRRKIPTRQNLAPIQADPAFTRGLPLDKLQTTAGKKHTATNHPGMALPPPACSAPRFLTSGSIHLRAGLVRIRKSGS